MSPNPSTGVELAPSNAEAAPSKLDQVLDDLSFQSSLVALNAVLVAEQAGGPAATLSVLSDGIRENADGKGKAD